MEGAAQLRLVLGVPLQVAQLAHAVRELALVAVLAHAGLLEGAAQLGLVARGGGRRGLAGRALQAAVAQLSVVSPVWAGCRCERGTLAAFGLYDSRF